MKVKDNQHTHLEYTHIIHELGAADKLLTVQQETPLTLRVSVYTRVSEHRNTGLRFTWRC